MTSYDPRNRGDFFKLLKHNNDREGYVEVRNNNRQDALARSKENYCESMRASHCSDILPINLFLHTLWPNEFQPEKRTILKGQF